MTYTTETPKASLICSCATPLDGWRYLSWQRNRGIPARARPGLRPDRGPGRRAGRVPRDGRAQGAQGARPPVTAARPRFRTEAIDATSTLMPCFRTGRSVRLDLRYVDKLVGDDGRSLCGGPSSRPGCGGAGPIEPFLPHQGSPSARRWAQGVQSLAHHTTATPRRRVRLRHRRSDRPAAGTGGQGR